MKCLKGIPVKAQGKMKCSPVWWKHPACKGWKPVRWGIYLSYALLTSILIGKHTSLRQSSENVKAKWNNHEIISWRNPAVAGWHIFPFLLNQQKNKFIAQTCPFGNLYICTPTLSRTLTRRYRWRGDPSAIAICPLTRAICFRGEAPENEKHRIRPL